MPINGTNKHSIIHRLPSFAVNGGDDAVVIENSNDETNGNFNPETTN